LYQLNFVRFAIPFGTAVGTQVRAFDDFKFHSVALFEHLIPVLLHHVDFVEEIGAITVVDETVMINPTRNHALFFRIKLTPNYARTERDKTLAFIAIVDFE
jgi:hypothetical protein